MDWSASTPLLGYRPVMSRRPVSQPAMLHRGNGVVVVNGCCGNSRRINLVASCLSFSLWISYAVPENVTVRFGVVCRSNSSTLRSLDGFMLRAASKNDSWTNRRLVRLPVYVSKPAVGDKPMRATSRCASMAAPWLLARRAPEEETRAHVPLEEEEEPAPASEPPLGGICTQGVTVHRAATARCAGGWRRFAGRCSIQRTPTEI